MKDISTGTQRFSLIVNAKQKNLTNTHDKKDCDNTDNRAFLPDPIVRNDRNTAFFLRHLYRSQPEACCDISTKNSEHRVAPLAGVPDLAVAQLVLGEWNAVAAGPVMAVVAAAYVIPAPRLVHPEHLDHPVVAGVCEYIRKMLLNVCQFNNAKIIEKSFLFLKGLWWGPGQKNTTYFVVISNDLASKRYFGIHSPVRSTYSLEYSWCAWSHP